MNDFGTGLIIGTFFGSFIGVALMVLMYMAKDYEPKLENPNPNYKPPMGKAKPEQKEPTILWTVGNICKWSGKVFEIYGFEPYYQNQTLALLKSDDGFYTAALVEELEAVE